jgi:hypothetical protein
MRESTYVVVRSRNDLTSGSCEYSCLRHCFQGKRMRADIASTHGQPSPLPPLPALVAPALWCVPASKEDWRRFGSSRSGSGVIERVSDTRSVPFCCSSSVAMGAAARGQVETSTGAIEAALPGSCKLGLGTLAEGGAGAGASRASVESAIPSLEGGRTTGGNGCAAESSRVGDEEGSAVLLSRTGDGRVVHADAALTRLPRRVMGTDEDRRQPWRAAVGPEASTTKAAMLCFR